MEHSSTPPNPEFDTDPFALTRYSEYIPHACAMLEQCGRNVNIFTQNFDPAILDNEKFSDALRAFVVGHSRIARVRILVQRPETAILQGHRLVELARKLTSMIEIRRPASQHAGIADAFLTFDNRAYLHRELGDRPEGKGCHDDSLRTLELIRRFGEVWSMSEPEAEFRRLGL
ncbi:MAG: hypothetical protein P1U54_10725 [Immundisolibacteraceae bacterium]|nr:hypothetical protein [Immundisolibacteraceae bacterium]